MERYSTKTDSGSIESMQTTSGGGIYRGIKRNGEGVELRPAKISHYDIKWHNRLEGLDSLLLFLFCVLVMAVVQTAAKKSLIIFHYPNGP